MIKKRQIKPCIRTGATIHGETWNQKVFSFFPASRCCKPWERSFDWTCHFYEPSQLTQPGCLRTWSWCLCGRPACLRRGNFFPPDPTLPRSSSLLTWTWTSPSSAFQLLQLSTYWRPGTPTGQPWAAASWKMSDEWYRTWVTHTCLEYHLVYICMEDDPHVNIFKKPDVNLSHLNQLNL